MARQNGRTDQSRYSCKFGHLHHCTALRAVPASLHHYFRTTLYYICCHLVNRLHLRWTEGRGLIYEERGREGGLKRRNRANNRRNEPPLSFARIASDGAGEREGEREGEIGRKKRRRRRSLKFRFVRLEDRNEIGGGGRMKSVCCYVHRGRWRS